MKKYIILSIARSGSNNLVNLLNRHPKITNYGEVLGEWTIPYRLHKKIGLGGKTVSEYLDYIYKSRLFFYLAQLYSAWSHFRSGKPLNFKFRKQVEMIGLKDFSSNFTLRDISSWLKERDDILVISLYRANTLKRFISIKKLEKGGAIALEKKADGSEQSIAKAFSIDISQLIKELDEYHKQLNEHLTLVNDLPPERVLSIRYEDMFSTPEDMFRYRDRIFEFLSVPPIGIESGHKKILPDDLSKVVENYDEMCNALKGTIYAQFIDQ